MAKRAGVFAVILLLLVGASAMAAQQNNGNPVPALWAEVMTAVSAWRVVGWPAGKVPVLVDGSLRVWGGLPESPGLIRRVNCAGHAPGSWAIVHPPHKRCSPVERGSDGPYSRGPDRS